MLGVRAIQPFRLAWVVAVPIGAMAELDFIWLVADTLNALMASDFVIVPTQCEYLSMHGVAHIEEVIKIIQRQQNKELDYKILITMLNQENTAAKVIYKKIQDKYGDKLLNTTIAYDPKMQESQIMSSPIYKYDKEAASAVNYLDLSEELTTG